MLGCFVRPHEGEAKCSPNTHTHRIKLEEENKKSKISSAPNILKFLYMKMARDPSANHRLSVATFSIKSSCLFAFLSMLLTIALFLPIEAVNNKTQDEHVHVKLSQGRNPFISISLFL